MRPMVPKLTFIFLPLLALGCANGTAPSMNSTHKGDTMLASGVPDSFAERSGGMTAATDAVPYVNSESTNPGGAGAPREPKPAPATAASERRIVTYVAGYQLKVKDVAEALNSAKRLADEFGGYIGEESLAGIMLRIPAARYAEAIARVEALGQVTMREQKAIDVTEEYVDLEARLRNATSTQARFNELLAKANDVKTALEVEKELKRVNEEIETLTAKLEVLRNRVAYSTISIAFVRVASQTRFAGHVRLPFHWLRDVGPDDLFERSTPEASR